MTDKILYWTTTVSSCLAFLLFVANTSLINSNLATQAAVNQRQLVINTAANVMPLNQQLSNALYDAAVKNNDDKIKTLLTSQGFTLPSKADKANAPKVAEETKAKKAAPSKKEEE